MTVTAEALRLPVLDEEGRALLFTEARTANSFADVPVSDEELRGIWELAHWSPSMANSQPLRVVFVRTPEGKERLAAHASGNNADKITMAPAVAILAYDGDFHEHMPTVFPARGEAMREQFSGSAEVRDTVAGYSAALQTGVFLLAVRAHGLAAGPMGGFDHDGVDADFLAGTTWKSHLLVNIGHPGVDPWFPRLPRLDLDTAVAWA